MRVAAFVIFLVAALQAAAVNSQKEEPADKFQRDILDAHNKHRAAHKVPPLKWCPKLTKLAQEWAEHLAKTDKMTHRDNSSYGENIYYSKNQKPDNKRPVNKWYDEIKLYDFKKPEFSFKTAHFTQVVWRDTKTVGAGIAKAGNKVWIVANYEPAGNMAGQFAANVPPPQK